MTLNKEYLDDMIRKVTAAFYVPPHLLSAGPRLGDPWAKSPGILSGMRVIETPHALLPVEATLYTDPPPSKHRSKRLWKKLRRKTARPHPGEPAILSSGDILFIHPALMPELRKQIDAQERTQSEAPKGGLELRSPYRFGLHFPKSPFVGSITS